MLNISRKLHYFFAFVSILALLLSTGCTGFFVNPNLTTITVGPSTPSVQQGGTVTLTATGTYDDGSTKNITGSATWSSSDVTLATVSSSGVVTGVASGKATITATSGTVSGSTSVTVTLANLVSITATPSSTSISSGATQQFTAMGTVQGGGQIDITDSVTWHSSNEDAATIDATGLATAKTVATQQQTNITATSGTIVSSPAAVLTVNP